LYVALLHTTNARVPGGAAARSRSRAARAVARVNDCAPTARANPSLGRPT
jgi:hypothetical protein